MPAHIYALRGSCLLSLKPVHGVRVIKQRTNIPMKTHSTVLLMALALAAPALNLAAQDAEQPQPRPPRPERVEQREGRDFERQRERGPREDRERLRGPRPEGQRPDAPRPPVPPLVGALDANHDGVIDEQEIAAAADALRKLDKNNDGKLTMEELRPPLPPRPQAPVRGEFRDGPERPRQSRGADIDRQGNRPDGPPPGDAPRVPRAPRPPQGEE